MLPAHDIHVRLPPILSPGSRSTVHLSAPVSVADESEDGTRGNEGEGSGRKRAEGGGGGSGGDGGGETGNDDSGPTDSWGKVFTSVTDLDIDQSVLIESFLDFPHLAYTHPSNLFTHPTHPTPTPVEVNTKFAVEAPGVVAVVNRPESKGSPFEVRFIAPCHVQISSNEGGYKFQQTIHCVSIRPGQTRVIYRHARNYWNWIDRMPFIGSLYSGSWAKRLMGEYQVLKGMQDRLREGAKPWNAPIQADLLPRYYREWYKRCMVKSNPFFSTFGPSALTPPVTSISTFNPYGPAEHSRPFTIPAPPRYTLAHIPHPAPSQLGIIQAASAAAATVAVQASAGASRRGSIANLVGVGGVGGQTPGSRRGSMIVVPELSNTNVNAARRGVVA
ncbi:hypothetical protein HKX48_007669 [Thoreauomyces humboldtii]|nr:hypothetical protein HKX48_007669 [Thoreauomyces humboldtii]